MKALKYKLMIYEGTMDFIHGGGHMIEEIYIPDENIVFNEQFVFKSDKQRENNEVEEIEIESDVVDILKKYIEYQDKLEEEKKKYLNNGN